MTDKIAKAISIVFHPIFMPTYGLIVIFNQSIYLNYQLGINAKLLLLALVFLFTFFIPSCIIALMKRLNLVKSFQMPTKEERFFPYLIIAASLYSFHYLIRENLGGTYLNIFVLGGIVMVLVNMLINIFWKISAHMAGIGALNGVLLGLAFSGVPYSAWWFILSLLTAGFIGSSRLYLKAHSQGQVYAGFLMGFTILFSISRLFSHYFVVFQS